MLDKKKILLIIGGGIAAVKIPELIRALTADGAEVIPVMSTGAEKFLTALTIAALAGKPVHGDLFDPEAEAQMGHIALSRAADCILVAPATANLLARAAAGQGDDLATCLLLASDKPVIMAPAMNVRMYAHPATRRNIQTLTQDGVHFIGPSEGDMACGEYGVGRLAETDDIIAAVRGHFSSGPLAGGPLAGRRAIITSGATREPIDPVRYISNRSSGRQGNAIAKALRAAGAEVCFISGQSDIPPPDGCALVPVESACDMLAAVEQALPADIAIFTAAVSDWQIAAPQGQKIKKTGAEDLHLEFTQTPDILAKISQRAHNRPTLVIGFAAETERLEIYAEKKLAKKGCDWIVANNVASVPPIMGGNDTQILLLRKGKKAEYWPRLSKRETAHRLIAEIAKVFS